jgi:hypothetical protein
MLFAKIIKPHTKRRVIIALLLSAVLHLLLVLIVWHWRADIEQPVSLHPVQMNRIAPERFKPWTPTEMPFAIQMERLRTAEPRVDGGVEAVDIPASEPVAVEPETSELNVDNAYPGKALGRSVEVDSLPTLNEMELARVQRRAEELEDYMRLWTLDADTTDAESRSRLKAEAIVWAAVEAMGGPKALAQVQDMQYRGRLHKRYGATGKYASGVDKIRFVYDGERGWVEVYGDRHALKGTGLREVQKRAERWDFLSRYLGDGIRVSYVGKRREGERIEDVIEVEDYKFRWVADAGVL